MKKLLSIFLIVALLLCSLPGCGTAPVKAQDEKLHIVTTIFPEYDWVREVLGDQAAQADITMLLDSGVDLHSYQPTAEDILKISTCDLFIYVGGESDAWVEDALREAANPDRKVIHLLNALGDQIKEEELVEGMEAEEEEEGEEEGVEYDEHVWLSLRNAQTLVSVIAAQLGEIDPEHKDIYLENAAAYSQKLATLDENYQEVVDAAEVKTLLFGDRFPFRYLADDYGLSYYAAFVGCSAETEASFETIKFLADKVDELGLHAVLTLEGADQKIGTTIVQATKNQDQQLLSMDSMQSVTAKDVADGTTYLAIMEHNLGVLKDALQ